MYQQKKDISIKKILSYKNYIILKHQKRNGFIPKTNHHQIKRISTKIKNFYYQRHFCLIFP